MKPIILLVDDNPEILDFISGDLSDRYSVLKALNSKQALDTVEIENIIKDVMMTAIDGFELRRIIKNNFDHSHIPIILLAAKSILQNKIEAMEVAADTPSKKSFSSEHLHMQLANLLANQNKTKGNYAGSPVANINSMVHLNPDESFLDKLKYLISSNMQNADLDVEYIANLMNMSKSTLYRKVRIVSNLTINEHINITRLKTAAKLLEEGDSMVYQVASLVGYSSQSHLARNFLKQFGMTPTKYQQSKRNYKLRLT